MILMCGSTDARGNYVIRIGGKRAAVITRDKTLRLVMPLPIDTVRAILCGPAVISKSGAPKRRSKPKDLEWLERLFALPDMRNA